MMVKSTDTLNCNQLLVDNEVLVPLKAFNTRNTMNQPPFIYSFRYFPDGKVILDTIQQVEIKTPALLQLVCKFSHCLAWIIRGYSQILPLPNLGYQYSIWLRLDWVGSISAAESFYSD